MRLFALMLMLIVVFASTPPVMAGESGTDSGDSESADTLDNAYPAVQEREPIQARPSVSGRGDAQAQSSDDAESE